MELFGCLAAEPAHYSNIHVITHSYCCFSGLYRRVVSFSSFVLLLLRERVPVRKKATPRGTG